MFYLVESGGYPSTVSAGSLSGAEPQLARISALVADVRRVLRMRHYSLRTETVYLGWIKRFILQNRLRHPVELGHREVEAFLTRLAVEGRVSPSTQNQALSALLFLYRDVLRVRLEWMEDHPLGTAGGLKLLKRANGPFLVINGDILTGVSFQEMLDYHRKHGAELTVGVRKYEVKVPFGVVECNDVRVTQLQEKPTLNLFVNAGVYLLQPSVCDYIPDGQRFDMTDLIQKLLEAGRPVVSFPIMEYWLDVGRPEDYLKAQEDVRNGKI